VTGVRTGKPDISYPSYIGGERNGPPEDCSGPPGFYELKCSLILSIRATSNSKNRHAITAPKRSTNFQSNTHSVESQTGATLPKRASPRRDGWARLPERPEQTNRGLYRVVTL
jgi:hypothetical protein